MKISMGGTDVGLNVAIEQAADVIMITDLTGVIRYVNAAFERVSGFLRGEVIGRHVRMLKSGKHDAAFYRHVWEALSRGQAWRGAFVNRRKDGCLYEDATVISPVRDDAGILVGYVAVKRDMTAERAKERQSRYMERLGTLGRLAGGVAHDFNNSLMTIMGNAEMLQYQLAENGESGEAIAEIKAACARAASLTRQLFAFGRRRAGEPSTLDVHEVVGGLEKMLRRLLGEEISLRTVREPGPALARFEAGGLEYLLLHLAVRAREVMPAGGTFTVKVSECEPSGDVTATSDATEGWIELRVSDTGVSLEGDAQGELAAPPGDCGKSRPGSAPLSLADSAEMVSRAGGRCSASYVAGEGTTFTILLPRVTPGARHLTSRVRDADDLSGSETVLVAEDEDGVRDLVRVGLSRLGYRVLDAADGPAAMERAALYNGRIHLLITDMVMPGMGGRELAERLLAGHPMMKIIYMSGYPNGVMGHQDVGGRGVFLHKPFTQEVLARTVRKVIERG